MRVSLLLLISPCAQAFLPTAKTSILPRQFDIGKAAMHMATNGNQNLLVISPPGGVGEVAAVQAAQMGSSVKWFVVAPTSQSLAAVSISPDTLDSIDEGKGSLDLAGASAETLLLPSDDSSSAFGAVSTWCSDANGVICTVDGIEESVMRAAREPGVSGNQLEASELAKTNQIVLNAIKVAAKEACSSSTTMKVAVIPASMEEKVENEEEEGPNLLSSLFGGNKVEIPKSLTNAMSKGSTNNYATLRYGELFGIPESSPDASPLVGGPRRYPVLRDEYNMRSIRIDPSLSMSGKAMDGNSRSSRFSVGEAAVRMASNSMDINGGLDVCVTSLKGFDCLSDEEWEGEFSRVQEMLSSGKGAQLFNASFGSVASIERLTDWIATKWAPAVMKTYDIAGIRVGARPVYASVVGEGKVQIVWQDIVNFTSVTVGKMIIDVNESGISAIRGPGDANDGYGSISPIPLQGEDIMVRRLSDAATQAIEKGLATKPAPKSRPKKEVVESKVVSTVISSGVVEEDEGVISSETGPRSSGARRSSERARGRRRKQGDDPKTQ